MSEKYKIGESHIPHFMTLTIIDWVDLFTRPVYKDIIINSLEYCAGNKGLRIHAFCIMTNHVHLIVSSDMDILEKIIRDFKKFTSKKLVKAIEENVESRRVWLLKKFEYAAKRIKRGRNYKVWQDGFHPVELSTNSMQDVRLNYVHNNPVVAGIVRRPEDYIYSSASFYAGGESILEVEMLE